MAKKNAGSGGTNRAFDVSGKWPTCEKCGRLLWVRPVKAGNPHLTAYCTAHPGPIHLDPPDDEEKTDSKIIPQV